MKYQFYILLLGTVLSALSACGSARETQQTDIIPKSQYMKESVSVPLEESAEENFDTAAKDSAELSDEHLMARQIDEQTFKVVLDGWGEVSFASFAPSDTQSGEGDVEFKLLKEGAVVYELPGYTEDNLMSDTYLL